MVWQFVNTLRYRFCRTFGVRDFWRLFGQPGILEVWTWVIPLHLLRWGSEKYGEQAHFLKTVICFFLFWQCNVSAKARIMTSACFWWFTAMALAAISFLCIIYTINSLEREGRDHTIWPTVKMEIYRAKDFFSINFNPVQILNRYNLVINVTRYSEEEAETSIGISISIFHFLCHKM